MKYKFHLFLLYFSIFTLISCNQDNTPIIPISEALEIKAYIYNDDLKSWSLQTLQLNEPELLVPIHILQQNSNELDMENFNLYFQYENGMCVMSSPDRDMQLSVGNNGDIWKRGDDMSTRVYDCNNNFEIILSRPGYMAVALFGMKNYNVYLFENQEAETIFNDFEPYIGQEYYLTVTGCDFDKVPVITAQLKFTSLEDDRYTDGTSRYFSIELVSYEYSDFYKMMEGSN